MSPLLVAEAARSAARGRLPLFGDFSLADPLFLALIPLAVLATLHGRSRRGREAGRVPALPVGALPRTARQRMAWLPAALQSLALVLVAIGLARPLRGEVRLRAVSEVVDVVLCIDRSSSMGAKDLEPGRTRLDVVKEVVGDYARRRMTDRQAAPDHVALITFARYPTELCPFTLDADAVLGFLGEVELAQFREEDGTAIGVALAKAVAVLERTAAKSKVVVLLTDGENNIDAIAPLEAAQLAAEAGVRVYTVFAGRYVRDPFGRTLDIERQIDTTELREIARRTGGRFFKAKDRAQLEAAYAEIEALERTPLEHERRVEHFDLYPRFLWAALALYGLAWLSAATWARRLP